MTDETGHEDRRNQVLLSYIEELEEGREPDRQRLLAEHPDLRPDLEVFLAGHDEVTRLTSPLRTVERSHGQGTIGSPRDEPHAPSASLGELGDFRLVREVGRGGMGVVYEAEQISLRRRVALKVLPFVAAIDPRHLQRFKTEALAAAQLQHERIVPVHAVGCERGVHYYAMRFIEGQSLAAFIEGLRELADDRPTGGRPESASGGKVTSAERTISLERSVDRRRYVDRVAGLGRQAAQALEHAHQAGVVHRDVKPGNLLLDVDGQLWVADFGLAQVTGDAGLTITGEMLGTLRYASPEQVLARHGIVDHRSDIYSLGATLYELLTLRPPFDGRERNSLIRQIVDDEPAPPRSLEPSIPVELETIVLKAMRKDPADRYGTAQELADDLQRFLEGRPVLARRPTHAERLRAWARRHPSVVGVGAVALVLVTTASLVSTALVRHEQGRTLAAQRLAQSAYLRERQRAGEAEARFRLARRAVDEMIRISEDELAHRPGMEGLRKRLLASAVAYYREFIDQRRSDPDAQAELRDTTRRVETILADLAVLRAAGELYLLVQPTALDALRLDDRQRIRVAELSARAGRRWMETFGDPEHLPSPGLRERLALEQARANEAEVNAILTPEQRLRLTQLALQLEGLGALQEPDVVEALGLTNGQRDRMRAVEEEAFFSQLRGMRSGTAFQDAEKLVVPRATDRILAILTADQLRRWKDLVGEPIRGPLSTFPGWMNTPPAANSASP